MYTTRTPAETARARKDLRVVPLAPGTPWPKAYKMYADAGPCAVTPLFWAREHLRVPVIPPAPTPKAPGLARVVVQLRDALRQPEASDAVTDQLARLGGGVLQLPTGFGKTTTALHVCHRVGEKVLVLVHKAFLADQWAERVAEMLPDATVSRIRGDACDTSGDVVIAMIQTLMSRSYPLEGFGLLVVDEVHHIAAEAFSRVMFLTARIPRRLGLSATPTRKDGLTRVIHWFFGPTAFVVERDRAAHVRVDELKYDCDRYRLPPPVNRRGDVCYASLMTQLCADSERTARVAAAAARLAARGFDVLVLSHRRDLCARLAAAVGPGAATYLGGDARCPPDRVVCATYSLASEGFDCPRFNALVLATPASDVVQATGRILRGNAPGERVIVDVVDAYGIAYAQSAKRRAMYRKAGFTLGGAAAAAAAAAAPPQDFGFIDDDSA
jgi:superfamily II DNA or RNA helicase